MTKQAGSRELERVLGPWVATALVVGTIIGSGIFKKPQAVAQSVPEIGLALAAWILVGIFTLMGSLAVAETASILPRAGGNYVFLREAYGRWAGFLWGWVEFWIIRSASIAALATIFTESLHDLLRQAQGLSGEQEVLSVWARHGITMAVIGALALVNAGGTILSGGLQLVITIVKAGTLLAIAVMPFILWGQSDSAAVLAERPAQVWPADWAAVNWSQFGAALVGVLWAYHGWLNLAPVAEEIKNPQRNIPLALLAGTLTVMALYVSANVAYYLVVPPAAMVDLADRTVAGEFCWRLLGPIGLILASAAIMVSVFGGLNGNMLVGPRLLFAMGRDRLAPAFLGTLHPRLHTPAWAVLVLAGWAMLLVAAVGLLVQYGLPVWRLGHLTIDLNLPKGANSFDVLTDYAIFGATSFETMGVAALFVLRHRFRDLDLPYRCPFYPWLPLVYVVFMAAVLGNMFLTKSTESLAAVGFITVGAVLYGCFWAGRT